MDSSVVVVGSLNADFVVGVEKFPAPGETVTGNNFAVFSGGKGANQAYAAARLGGRVSMIGQVGDDAYAGWLKQNLASVGADVSHVETDANVSSGVAVISVDAFGQNQIVIVPGANGTFTGEHVERSRERIAGAGIVLLQLEIPLDAVETAAHTAKAGGALVILDPAPAIGISDELLRLADYITPNETELATLTGAPFNKSLDRAEAAAMARALQTRGAQKVIVKMGARGALLIAEDEELFWPSIPVMAVDTTAAGDAFNGAFAVALAAGKTEAAAGRFATAAAACSVTRKGAQPSMPTFAEVEELLRTTK